MCATVNFVVLRNGPPTAVFNNLIDTDATQSAVPIQAATALRTFGIVPL